MSVEQEFHLIKIEEKPIKTPIKSSLNPKSFIYNILKS